MTGECNRENCFGLMLGGKVSLRREQFLSGSEDRCAKVLWPTGRLVESSEVETPESLVMAW